MVNPVVVAVLGIFPQMILLFYSSLGLVGAKTKLRSLVVPALIATIVVYITRSVPSLFGWHIPVFLVSYVAIAKSFRLTTLIAALASAALSFILVALGDVLFALPALNMLGYDFNNVAVYDFAHILFGWLESILLLAAAFLVKYRSFILIPVVRREQLPGGPGDFQ